MKNFRAAFLRGINVGGNAAVSMKELKLCFEELGYRNVQTYINSGNVIFESSKLPRELENEVEQKLKDHFGFAIKVVVRSFQQMQTIIENLPKSWSREGEQKCNVIFLRHEIDKPKILNELYPKPGIEELHYHPGVLLWSAQTGNLTKSNMIKLSQSELYKNMTVRNLNTTRKIYALLQQATSSN